MALLMTCLVEWCEKDERTRGLCAGHYHRLRRYGNAEGGPNPRPVKYAPDAVCAFDGCGKPRKSREWCSAHYARWRIHGDPATTLHEWGVYRIPTSNGYVRIWVPGHPVASADGYALEHRYVAYEMGWAIDGMHVHHIDHDKTNNDPDNLEVMTPEEHIRQHGKRWNSGQFTRQTHCKWGHEFTPENTYTYGLGKHRECYTCKRSKAKGNPRTYPESVRSAAVDEYLAGAPLALLRQKYGVTPGTMTSWVRKAGAPVRPAGRPRTAALVSR